MVGSFWLLVVAIIAYQFFVDVSRPWEPLFNEVIPPKQRGRAGVFRMILVYAAAWFFSSALIYQFDFQYEIPTPLGQLTGEQVAYWTVSLALLLIGGFLWFFVKETKPPTREGEEPDVYRNTWIPGVQWRGEQEKGWAAVKLFFKDMFGTKLAWYIYMLYACPVIAGAATNNPNRALFMVDQVGVSKAELGILNAYTMPVIMLVFTPLGGYLADRWDRVRMMQFGIALPALIQLGFVGYLRWWGNYEYSFAIFLTIALLNGFFNSWLVAVWGPVIFDYIPSSKMGTFAAGFTLVGNVIQFVLMNTSGFWVKGWTSLFGAPGKGLFDYSSIFALDVFFSVFSIAGTILFMRASRRGIIRAEGRLELEEAESNRGM